ncbi:pyrroline-5-carboxylate reductase [Metabacillus herbersteinensis]|uniref:Pyrroline-5-carboxylate reductase n=1 Tax=Metabacillus herbersteinensis TaxID=283816 RepID=A0ABV6GJN5_9BACI
MEVKPTMLLIGAGRMAEAIISGLVNTSRNNIEDIFVSNRSDKQRLKLLQEKYQVVPVEDWKSTVDKANIIVLAMPPEAHELILEELSELIDNQFIVTIAAGMGPTKLERKLPSNTAVAWIMPNTAAEIGESISLYCFGKHVEDSYLSHLKLLLNAIGESQLCTEQQIHDLTAITGSAPAFFYLFTESLIEKAQEYGISKEVAKNLVSQMMYGSASMLKAGKQPSELREQVTTPGGATAEGLKVLDNGDFSKLISDAVVATNHKARGNT